MRSKLICVGIWFSVLYWIGDAALDVFIFHEGTITAQIFNPELFEIVVRILAICIILSFSTIAQLASNK